MPLWVFFCPTCHTHTEKLFPNYAASQQATCEVCGTLLEREFSSGAIIFKGPGFYKTDYKGK